MKINSCIKVCLNETHRAKKLNETYEVIKDIPYIIGVTRVADITKLDRIGIPVYSCIRPDSQHGSISIYNGKGLTKEAAKISAIMESIERYSAESHSNISDNINTYKSIYEINSNALNPKELILPENINYNENTLLHWSKAYQVDSETMNLIDTFVPSCSVYHPFESNLFKLFRTNTNGIASGNTIEEAIVHGLYEVIERDAWSLVESSNIAGSIIEDIEDRDINHLLDLFSNAGIEIILRNITSDLNITTIAAIADDIETKDPTMLCMGMGTHTSPRIAAIRALTEVAQSRATQIHGAREDTIIGDIRKKIGYERTKKLNKKWFLVNDTCKYDTLIDNSFNDFKNEIRYIIDILKRKNLNKVIIRNLTKPEINIPVVRVIVPGLECFSIDSERYGTRCRNIKYKK